MRLELFAKGNAHKAIEDLFILSLGLTAASSRILTELLVSCRTYDQGLFFRGYWI